LIVNADELDDISVFLNQPFQMVYIGGVRIIKDNSETEHGLIHIVDRVIAPFDVLELSK